MPSRLIIHQFDPRNLHVGGIDTCISDMIAYAPPEVDFAIVGATSGADSLGTWQDVEHRGRTVAFMPVAKLWTRESRRVPDSAKVAAGLLRWRRRVPEARLQLHRLDLAAAARTALGADGYVQFIHNPHGAGAGVVGKGSDSFWRHAPAIYHRLEGRTLRHAGHVVAFSGVEAKRLRSAGANALAFQTWFDPSIFVARPKTPGDAVRIACVGRLERQKDPVLALETMGELRARGVFFRGTFMGSGSMRPVLERRAEELGIGEAVRFVGPGSRQDVAQLLHDADVLLLTSHYEGSPRIVIESLATGTPVAATVGADPDGLVDTKTGARSESRTPAALAQAVLDAAGRSSADCVAAVLHLRADIAVPELIARTA